MLWINWNNFENHTDLTCPWEGLDVGRVSQQGLGRLGAKPSKAAITTHDFPITNSEDQGSYAAATPVIIFLVKIVSSQSTIFTYCDWLGKGFACMGPLTITAHHSLIHWITTTRNCLSLQHFTLRFN